MRRPGTSDRDAFLLDAAAGRIVTHVGFADTGMRDVARRDGHWLHARLAAVARSLVGVDVDADGVAEAKEAGYEAHLIDCRDPADVARAAVRPAELLVVGEVIEHVDSVGAFLDGLRALATPDGTMIVTTPNAFRLLNVAATLTGRELVHPDHVSWYSWYTLINVLERHSWRVVAFHPYAGASVRGTGRSAVGARGRTRRGPAIRALPRERPDSHLSASSHRHLTTIARLRVDLVGRSRGRCGACGGPRTNRWYATSSGDIQPGGEVGDVLEVALHPSPNTSSASRSSRNGRGAGCACRSRGSC